MNTLRNELKRDFSQIPNELITDLTLSAGSLRVLLYLFTKSDEWNVYNLDICKRLDISEQTLTKYWKQLIKSGWLRRYPSRNEKGHLTGGYTYQIGNFTTSIKSTESVKSIDNSNNKPIKKQETNKSEFNNFIISLKEKASIKSKVTKTKDGEVAYKKIDDKQKLFNDYLEHQLQEKNFAKRITAFMEDYDFHSSECKKEEDSENWGWK